MKVGKEVIGAKMYSSLFLPLVALPANIAANPKHSLEELHDVSSIAITSVVFLIEPGQRMLGLTNDL